MPQFNGGTDWGGAAYDPQHRRLYVNCSNEAEWISMVPAAPTKETTRFQFGKHFSVALHAMSLHVTLVQSCTGGVKCPSGSR
ncbi:MAG: hypothetical protein IPL46_32235 [Saprospiraceae bacterium]|nr:hypothetical protein [Saprospiraceae bacterium]